MAVNSKINLFPEDASRKVDSFFISDILFLTTEDGLRLIETICRYLLKATVIDAETVVRAATALPETAKEMIMTTAEKLINQGKQEGEKKAKTEDARKMLEKGYPIEDICEITGLSRKDVEKLK